MPCYKGIAVSIHANGAPLPEYGMQKQSKVSRVTTYIPVPKPNLSEASNKTEPSTFAISVTLLTPGLPIPYSTPKPTADNPYPQPQLVTKTVGGGNNGVVTPYIPMTNSENETIAAYIYFDGRGKEEVATLLRPGEETWVNSRWVQVPPVEGGGLAEREFLFREVGLEKWLNGLDLHGHDAAAKLEKRRQKFERRRRKQKTDNDAEMMENKTNGTRDALRYGNDAQSPVEPVFDEDSFSSSDDEFPEAAGQIKVAMFRVLASGEIKKGEYSPQFGAHDDDDDVDSGKNGVDADVEHTTSFAKPKSLDPKTISTQTVTGIDGPDKPYATFTFFYRGERQLQKVGILPSSKVQQPTPSAIKRRSGQLDFSSLGPLKTTGTVGFSTFRDHDVESARRRKSRKRSSGSIGAGMDEDSDDDDDDDHAILTKMEDIEEKDDKDVRSTDAPEDAKFTGELAEGVDRIKLKRQRSAEPDNRSTTATDGNSSGTGPFGGNSPPDLGFGGSNQSMPISSGVSIFGKGVLDEPAVGSPMKKQRPSEEPSVTSPTGGAFAGARQLQHPTTSSAFNALAAPSPSEMKIEEEEEL